MNYSRSSPILSSDLPLDAASTAPSARRPAAAYPRALVEAALERVVTSHTFRRSQPHRHFVEHVVRAALAGEHERLKEVIIGLEVFGRRLPLYDPRRDPIVRVEAGRVREKLARYYAAEGAGDAFEIVIPAGAYLPHLLRRKTSIRAPRKLGSLAVLPFTNLSGHADDASFSSGLADQLIDTLGRVPGLRVVARVSAFKARANGTNLKSIGKLLGVDNIVEGSIQRSGSRVRCIAQLTRARDGSHIWSQRFEHNSASDDDFFAFQDRIADAVLAAAAPSAAWHDDGSALSPALSLRPVGTDNRQARDLFERGRYMAQLRTIEGYPKAIELLERAVALDPDFAQAYTLLGAARANFAAFVSEPTIPAFAQVELAARRVLELDPLDGDARALLGMVAYRIEFNWKKAEPLFRDALRLAPNSTVAHGSYAWGLVFNGRFDEAIAHARIARELDPLNIGLRANNALIHAYARDFDTAIAEAHAVLDLDAHHLFSHMLLGLTHLWLREPASALPYFERIATAAPEHPSAHFCMISVLGMRGEIERGTRELAALILRLGTSHYSQVNRATAEISLGDRRSAYESLERAAQARDVLFASIPADPLFGPCRDDPAFVALLQRHGLDVLPASLIEALPKRSTASA